MNNSNTGRKASYEHRTVSGTHAGRKASCAHMNTGRFVVLTPDGNRPTEEYKDYLKQERSQEYSETTPLEPQVVGGW